MVFIFSGFVETYGCTVSLVHSFENFRKTFYGKKFIMYTLASYIHFLFRFSRENTALKTVGKRFIEKVHNV